jgi:hypothetical protein
VGHRIGPVHCPVRHLAPALTLRAQSALFTFAVDRWRCIRYSAWHTGQSGATPDSPVNYSEGHFQKPEGGKFGVDLPGAPDSPVRQTRAAFGCLLLFLFEPVLGLFIGLC